MSPTAAQVLEQALRLNQEDRASVAGALFQSLPPEMDRDVSLAWNAEIHRRAHELDSGLVETIPWSEVRQQLFDGFE